MQDGLEGVPAFASEIAEPDRDGGAPRRHGVDIQEAAPAPISSPEPSPTSTAVDLSNPRPDPVDLTHL